MQKFHYLLKKLNFANQHINNKVLLLFFMTKIKKSNKLFLTQNHHPKKNPKIWIKLLNSVSRTGHTSGPTSENYIQGYKTVFEKWGIINKRGIDLNAVNKVIKEYDETRKLPEFKP